MGPHGGRRIEARRLFPSAPEPFIYLSTGINPLSYPIPAIETSAWTRLPEPEAIARLEAVAAKAYGVADGSMVASVPGTQLLISLLPQLSSHASVAILGPTYGEYARSFEAAGRRVVEASTLDALADAACAILCNPNNPDGRRFDACTLLALARQRVGDGLLIVDESFADLESDGLSLASYLPLPGVLVLRSLSKSYGLAASGSALRSLIPTLPHRSAPRSAPGRSLGLRSRSDHSRLPIAPGAKPRSSGLRKMSYDSMGCCARPA